MYNNWIQSNFQNAQGALGKRKRAKNETPQGVFQYAVLSMYNIES